MSKDQTLKRRSFVKICASLIAAVSASPRASSRCRLRRLIRNPRMDTQPTDPLEQRLSVANQRPWFWFAVIALLMWLATLGGGVEYNGIDNWPMMP